MTEFFSKKKIDKMVPINKLTILWPDAQREFNESWAKKLARELDPDMFGTISLSAPNSDGLYHVIDGMHRTAAAREALGENQKVPCSVYVHVNTAMRAAEMFDEINTNVKSVHPIDKFLVRVTRNNETQVVVNNIINRAGYIVSKRRGEGRISAVHACQTVYKKYGGNTLIETFRIIQLIWGKDAGSTEQGIIQGVAKFVSLYNGKFDKNRLAEKVVAQYTPGRLIGAARSGKEMFGGSISTAICKLLVTAYNHGLSKNKLKQ